MIASLCSQAPIFGYKSNFRSSPSLVLAGLPLKKLLEQLLALGRTISPDIGAGGAFARQKLFELIARGRRRRLRLAILREPFVSPGKPRPTRQRCGEIGLAPFRMVRRLLQRGDLGKERIDETADAPVAVGILGPIVGDEHRSDRDRFDALFGAEEEFEYTSTTSINGS